MSVENNLYRNEKQERRAKVAFNEIKTALINHPIVKDVMQSTEFAGIDEREDVITFYVGEVTAFTLVKYSAWGCFFQAIHEAQSSSDFIYIDFHDEGYLSVDNFMEDIGLIVKKFEHFVEWNNKE
jgi:hypothetical protein